MKSNSTKSVIIVSLIMLFWVARITFLMSTGDLLKACVYIFVPVIVINVFLATTAIRNSKEVEKQEQQLARLASGAGLYSKFSLLTKVIFVVVLVIIPALLNYSSCKTIDNNLRIYAGEYLNEDIIIVAMDNPEVKEFFSTALMLFDGSTDQLYFTSISNQINEALEDEIISADEREKLASNVEYYLSTFDLDYSGVAVPERCTEEYRSIVLNIQGMKFQNTTGIKKIKQLLENNNLTSSTLKEEVGEVELSRTKEVTKVLNDEATKLYDKFDYVILLMSVSIVVFVIKLAIVINTLCTIFNRIIYYKEVKKFQNRIGVGRTE